MYISLYIVLVFSCIMRSLTQECHSYFCRCLGTTVNLGVSWGSETVTDYGMIRVVNSVSLRVPHLLLFLACGQ